MTELQLAVIDFFEILDQEEESDGGLTFHPTQISCCRILLQERIEGVVERMKYLAYKE